MLKTLEKAGCLVLGGGVVGTAAARALTARGERVMLVERFKPGHGHGSSHGASRIFRFAYAEPIYRELAARALSGWRALEEESGESLLHLHGNWYCAPEGSAELAAIVQGLRDSGFEASLLSARESNTRFPRLFLPAGMEVLFQPDGGVLLADRCLRALWEGAEAAGASMVSGEEILGLEVSDRGTELAARGGRRYRAPRLLVAAGSWSAGLLAQLDCRLPLAVTREQVAFCAAEGELAHGLADLPTVVDHSSEKHFYALPAVRGLGEDRLGVKVGRHMAGRPIEHPDLPIEVDLENLAAVEAWVRERLPHVIPKAFRVEHCLYTTTPDKHFILDHHPSEKRVTIAAGFSGHGFKFAPALGEVLAALALEEESPAPLAMFAAGRFGGKTG